MLNVVKEEGEARTTQEALDIMRSNVTFIRNKEIKFKKRAFERLSDYLKQHQDKLNYPIPSLQYIKD